MAHESSKRKYELRKRADAMAATRLRITEAAMELHGSLGPSRTTVSAVAERAGVQRHTVYRHFPTDADLFAACSQHYWVANPSPELDPWTRVHDPEERLALALDELYGFYERVEPMLAMVIRDEQMPVVGAAFAPFRAYLEEGVKILARGRPRRRAVTAALKHAVAFETWRSLARHGGLGRDEAVRLMSALIEAA
jgi:AcrR family transcriptional regulator